MFSKLQILCPSPFSQSPHLGTKLILFCAAHSLFRKHMFTYNIYAAQQDDTRSLQYQIKHVFLFSSHSPQNFPP